MALGGISTQTSHHCKHYPPLFWLSTSRPGPSSMGSHSSFSLWVASRKALYRDCSCRLPIANGTFSSISGFSSSLKVKQSSSCNIMSSSGKYRHYPTDSSWKLEVLSGAGNPCARMVPNLSGYITSDREPVSCSPQLTKEENDIMSSSGEYRHYPMDSSWKLEVLSGAGNSCVRMVPNLSGHITSDREPDPQLMEQENKQILEDKAARLWIEEADRLVKEKYELRDSNTPVFVHSNYNPVGFGIPRVEATANSGQYGLTDMQDGSDHLLSKDLMEASMVSGNSSREGALRSSLGQGYMHSQAHTSGACSVKNEGNTSLIEKGPIVQSEGIEYNGSGGLSKEREEKTSKPLSGSSIDKPEGFDQFHVRERLVRIYEKVLVVDNISMARETVRMLTNQYRHRVYACDTEVAKIDVKQETPVDHGEMICFSIYSGPEVNFGNGKSCIWVDLLAECGKTILAEFAPFFEDTSIKKVWHNYSFDNHIIENYGFKVSGFHADTMHMARLWDSSRQTEGGYSLEALSGDPRVCHDENLIGKVSMKTIFGRGKVKKDGSNGKIITIPPVEELQREDRKLWICYSALDSISTLNLYESLKRKLSGMEWKVDGCIEGTMLDFYEKYWQPFGELLVTMETEGMLVDRAYLAEVEKVARAEQQVAANRFRNWASKYCPDAKYMNVGSDTQLRLLLFGGTLNSKDQNESLPLEKDFKVPNIEKVIEEGKKTPTKFRNIKLCRLESKLEPEMYTASGWPSVCGDALKTLAGKVSAEFDFTDEAQVLETKEGVSEDKESAYGTAYAAFGGGLKGKEACHAIAALCEVCSIDSLISNFILPLQGSHISGKNGRIHGSLNINTETGRLSARRPSLQNQPALEKDRYKIRQAFVAAPGNSLIVADYGQLELRILAHLANCKSMLDAFKAGGDFHSRTAMNMYPHICEAVEQKSVLLEWHPQPGEDKPPVPLLKDAFASERRKAKMLNFSIAYGKTPVGLSRDWKVSVKEAKETVARWYNERKEVRNWQDERKKEACSKKRCVHTLLGRARLFPSVDRVTSSQRGHIERAAINTPVQGSAADVAMCAMLEILKNLRLKELGWRLLLQVHDEVILEGPTESAEEAKAIVVECMSKPFDGKNILRVDLSVDAKCAQNWYSAK
ncbi:DNA polymerase I A, chloroplastic/mitochondrial-like [Rhododendron vialii]|uniref:DNA polymerase I A, chloroplastic/mitochondrial-like n=1 Tax=Rhododendron vialii TaxID=182163 RepID=UPI00265FB51D|nr:DNA polymerase I A, chloroplastic/mitochondrial-like [Rhododendron vialii]